MDVPHKDLIKDIEAFCAARDMKETRFGTDALGDPSFVREIKSGRECRRATLDKVTEFMASARSAAA